MARRFRGEWVHKVDAKGRVSIPAPFRRALEEGDPDWREGEQPTLILVYGRTAKRCLEGYSVKAMEEVDELIATFPRFSREREAFERMLSTQSQQMQVDENGRIVLSQKLRARAGLEAEAIFAGMGDTFQIWDPGAYEADQRAVEDWLAHKADAEDPFTLLDRARLER